MSDIDEMVTDISPATVNNEINPELLTRLMNTNLLQIKEGLKSAASSGMSKSGDNAEWSAESKANIMSWSIPDYSAGINLSNNTPFVPESDGVVTGEFSGANGGACYLKVDGVTVCQLGSENAQRCRGPLFAIVGKGSTVLLQTVGQGEIPIKKFFPFKGANNE